MAGRPGCSFAPEAAEIRGRKAQRPLTGPCCCHTVEGSSSRAVVASSDKVVDCSNQVVLVAVAEGNSKVGKVRHGLPFRGSAKEVCP